MASTIRKIIKNSERLKKTLSILEKHLQEGLKNNQIPTQFNLSDSVENELNSRKELKRKERNKRKAEKRKRNQ